MSRSLHAAEPAAVSRPKRRNFRARYRRRSRKVRLIRFFRSISLRVSSSLTRRIVVLNLTGLFVLFLLFLYVNQFREGLIDARVQSLQAQGEIIAAAIASSATVQTDSLTLDPEKLLQQSPGQSPSLGEDDSSALEFSINPDRIGPVLRRLVSPTRTRARVFDQEGDLLIDTRVMSFRNTVGRPKTSSRPAEAWPVWSRVVRLFSHEQAPKPEPSPDDSETPDSRSIPEVVHAMEGSSQYVVRVNAVGQTIVSVAVPIERSHIVKGVLLLSTQGGDIDAIIAAERWGLVRVFIVAAVVMFLLSVFLAGTIAGPMRRLAEAAERVRRGVNTRQEIPDYTQRSDEIGHLSGALRDMTHALYTRLEAIESFAADVAHELKNPLTSLRSAVETLPRIKAEASRERLMEVIQHDIRRLDRLISDISDASRLDAELARGGNAVLDVAALAKAVVEVANGLDRDGVSVSFRLVQPDDEDLAAKGFVVEGHDSRLGQVLNNLIDNARSFSPPGEVVRVTMRLAPDPVREEEGETGVEIVVDDNGPGIPADAFERIFERFYTDRPSQGFGQNSGLGLSISRQIIAAHGGLIWAENRLAEALDEDDTAPASGLSGARFTVWLPIARR